MLARWATRGTGQSTGAEQKPCLKREDLCPTLINVFTASACTQAYRLASLASSNALVASSRNTVEGVFVMSRENAKR